MSPEEVTVECTWKIEHIDEVWNKILWKEKLAELAEETNIENCFNMSQITSDPRPCSLKICLRKNRKFVALQILSEVLSVAVIHYNIACVVGCLQYYLLTTSRYQ